MVTLERCAEGVVDRIELLRLVRQERELALVSVRVLVDIEVGQAGALIQRDLGLVIGEERDGVLGKEAAVLVDEGRNACAVARRISLDRAAHHAQEMHLAVPQGLEERPPVCFVVISILRDQDHQWIPAEYAEVPGLHRVQPPKVLGGKPGQALAQLVKSDFEQRRWVFHTQLRHLTIISSRRSLESAA